jgi:hypothetical protein
MKSMDVSNRQWWIRIGDAEEGPVDEETFQVRLRAGEVSLKAMVKSNYMENWEPLLKYISTDETFRRPSTMPKTDPDNHSS